VRLRQISPFGRNDKGECFKIFQIPFKIKDKFLKHALCHLKRREGWAEGTHKTKMFDFPIKMFYKSFAANAVSNTKGFSFCIFHFTF